MAKKATPTRPGQKQPEWQTQICDTCRFSSWVTDDQRHYDLEGKPICLRCPHYQWYIVRGRKACGKWERKPKEVQP